MNELQFQHRSVYNRSIAETVMPTLQIPDDIFKATGLSEGELLVEVACRLFQANRLTLWQAARFAGLDRSDLEDALLDRGIPIYHPTPQDLAEDLRNLDEMGV